MKYLITLIISINLISCSSESEKISRSKDLNFLSNYITTFLYDCTDSNDLKLHRKAEYRQQDSTFIFFVGKSLKYYNEKWEIPVKDLYLKRIKDDDSKMWDILEIKGKIKYQNSVTKEIEKHSYHTIYLYEWCNKKNEMTNFKLAFSRMIKLCN